jgi:DNA-binding NarL/FixJ family response regulator
MPEVTGLDVIHSLKKENLLDVNNIVIFTASSCPKILGEIRNCGIKGILNKACSIDELTTLIDKFPRNN